MSSVQSLSPDMRSEALQVTRTQLREQCGALSVGGRDIGPGFDVYIVAEISANHNQQLDRAIETIRAAKMAGADAVKLQTYTPDTITLRSDKEYFRIKGTLWNDRTLYDLYKEAYTPWDWHPKLKQVAEDEGLQWFSTPFDASAVDFLEELDVPAYKVASFEIVDLPLLRSIARTGKPVIVSTGMATLGEIDEAVRTLKEGGTTQIALLKCTSAYPSPPEEMNLRTIPHLQDSFGLPVGLSDHTLGVSVPVAAVALGACIVEKHFTLSRADGGPDSAFSLEPDEFRSMVQAIRHTERALGGIHYGATRREKESRRFRRSLFVVKDVRAGERLTEDHIRSIRPAHGLHPRYFETVLGRRASRDIDAGTPLSWDLIVG